MKNPIDVDLDLNFDMRRGGASSSRSSSNSNSRSSVQMVPPRRKQFVPLFGSAQRDEAVTMAKQGIFTVRGSMTVLAVPIDWQMDPHLDRSWRFSLHTWRFLEPVLHAAASGDLEALRIGIDIALDWIASNPQVGDNVSEFAWYDMAVGGRAACLGFLARIASTNGYSREATMLLRSAEEHGTWLADNKNYNEAHNHGLFEDGGLALLCMQLPDLPKAPYWHAHAKARFARNVAATISESDGFHLEHSPAYHVMILELIARISEGAGLADDHLPELVQRMRTMTPWLVLPDGMYAQLGDTDLQKAPDWVAGEMAPDGLLLAKDAGLAGVAKADERLLTVGWYHVKGHKHADELSVCWYAAGVRLLVDTGGYGYYYDEPGRKYAESSRGHNVLTRADREFTFRDQPKYGSGIFGAGEGGGWYAVLGHNPLLTAQDVEHRRLLLYRPSELLYVIDLANNTAKERPQLRRHFHFGPAVEVIDSKTGDEWRLSVRGREIGALYDLPATGGHQNVLARQVRGQRDPEPQGFNFPSARTWTENWALMLDSPADVPVLCAVFSLGALSKRPRFNFTTSIDGTFHVAVGSDATPFSLRIEPPGSDGSMRIVAQ
jgi:hypothetical protein